MIIIKTETGSAYELDTENKRIRRLHGEGNPSPRVGTDGQWREYASITAVEVGSPLLVAWPDTIEPKAAEGAVPATITSKIVSISKHGLN